MRHRCLREFHKIGIQIFIVYIAAALTGCGAREGESYSRLTGEALGTYYSVVVASPAGDTAARWAIDSTLGAINATFSIYDSGTVISRFNRAAAFVTHGEFAALLAESQRVSALTRGAYDPTVGALARLWGFGADEFSPVDSCALAEARSYTGYEHLRVSGDTVYKDDSRVELTLNAMAKGYAADRIALALRRGGHGAAMVEVGGEISAYGVSPRGDAWRVGIDAPEKGNMPGEKLITSFTLDSGGVATSGNYREYVQRGEKEWGHTINPRTGRPEKNSLLSATVLAPTCAAADALATAMMVMGPEESKALVERTEGVECLLIYRDGGKLVQWASRGIRNRMEQ